MVINKYGLSRVPFSMSKGQPPPIGIEELVQQVGKEILDAQRNSKNPMFELDTVELEIKFVTTKEVGGKIKLLVASLSGNYSKELTHSVKLTLKPFAPTAQVPPKTSSEVLPPTPPKTIILENTKSPYMKNAKQTGDGS